MNSDDSMPDTEVEAARVLIAARWPDGWVCPRCGNPKCSHLETRPRVLACTTCQHQQSVTAGTPLARCRVPLVKVIRAARLLAREASISARKLAEELDVCYETAWSLGHRLRAGHVAEQLRLDSVVRLRWMAVKRRPPFGKKRGIPLIGITVLWDHTGRAVARAGRPDPHSARRFLDRHTDAEVPLVPDSMPAWLQRPLARILNRVHRSVSDRWLPFYAGSVVAWTRARALAVDAFREMLRATLARTTHPFRVLRPGEVTEHLDLREWHERAWPPSQDPYSRTQELPSQ